MWMLAKGSRSTRRLLTSLLYVLVYEVDHLNVRKLGLTDANVIVRTDRSLGGEPVPIEAG